MAAAFTGHHMKTPALIFLALSAVPSMADEVSPYAGEEHRSIKSMSAQEIESLESGAGMGFARAAELNHYPGPRHVLELAGDLDLSPAQLSETEALYEEMHAGAVALGEELLQAETGLDRAFREATISPESLRSALDEIARIQARLRYVHLEAHLRQRSLLSAEQIAKYDEVRGYRHATHHDDAHRD